MIVLVHSGCVCQYVEFSIIVENSGAFAFALFLGIGKLLITVSLNICKQNY